MPSANIERWDGQLRGYELVRGLDPEALVLLGPDYRMGYKKARLESPPYGSSMNDSFERFRRREITDKSGFALERSNDRMP